MNKSESIAELSKAMVCFQGKLVTVKKESKNPYFNNKYASLSAIIEAVQKPLTECGLAVVQLPSGQNQLETILMHESGEFISEMYEMKPTKNDPQGLGSAITYQRRYALGAVLCLNIDEDDDGNKASEPVNNEKQTMTDERFAKMCDVLRGESKEEANKHLKQAFKTFTFDANQTDIINQIIDNK